MPHDHGHAHIDPASGDRRVSIAIWANALLTVAQIVGGILSGSLALIADALHNFSDMASSGDRVRSSEESRRRPADGRMTFGYGRIEVVAALINYTTLILVGYLSHLRGRDAHDRTDRSGRLDRGDPGLGGAGRRHADSAADVFHAKGQREHPGALPAQLCQTRWPLLP